MVLDHDFDAFPELSNRQLQTLELASPHPQITEDFHGVVERVVDGDTLTISTPSRDFSFPLRLLGINAPELQEGGEEAKAWLQQRIEGREVFVRIDPRQRVGKYGRLLGRVVADGLDVGDEMINMGLAAKFGLKDEGEPEPIDKIFDMRQWRGRFA